MDFAAFGIVHKIGVLSISLLVAIAAALPLLLLVLQLKRFTSAQGKNFTGRDAKEVPVATWWEINEKETGSFIQWRCLYF